MSNISEANEFQKMKRCRVVFQLSETVICPNEELPQKSSTHCMRIIRRGLAIHWLMPCNLNIRFRDIRVLYLAKMYTKTLG
jgi:hypothetical protein